jgi:hypothetical protein
MSEDLVKPSVIRGEGLNGYGRALVRIGLRAQRMESALRLVEYGGPGSLGCGPCPACSRFPGQGHEDSCFLQAALQHGDPITHAEECLTAVRDLVRTQQSEVQMLADGLKITLSHLDDALSYAARLLDRL